MKSFCLIFLFSFLYTSIFAETDSELVNYVSIQEVAGNKLVRTDSITIQINNSKGEYATFITIPYSKGDKLSIGDAWIEDMSGNIIRKLKKSDFSDHSAVSNITIYEDRYVKRAQLRHHQYPYRISYSYKRTVSDFIHVCYWMPLLYWYQDVKSAKLIVDVPAQNYPVRIQEDYIDKAQISESGDRKRYIWQTSCKAAKGNSSYTTISSMEIPIVKVVPLKFKYEAEGSWQSWQNFGNWICKINKNSTILPEEEKQKVNSLLTGISDPVEKIRILYQYLQQQTRYINVSIKTGGLKTYPASYVCQNKYGDCKALSTYMISLLEQAGIEAFYTLIKSGNTIETIDKTFPFQAFDHVIVTVPLKNDTLFLECTGKNIPAGYLGTFTQGRDALAVRQDSSFFVQTPALTPEDVHCTSHIQVAVNRNLPIDVKMSLKGPDFDKLNYLLFNQSKKEIEKEIRDMLSINNVDVESFDLKRDAQDLTQMRLESKIRANNLVKVSGKNIILSPISMQQLPALEDPKDRKGNFLFCVPISRTDTIEYVLVQDVSQNTPPENISIESPYGNYSLTFNYQDNKFRIIKNICLFSGVYSREEYALFHKFWSDINSNEEKNYYIEMP